MDSKDKWSCQRLSVSKLSASLRLCYYDKAVTIDIKVEIPLAEAGGLPRKTWLRKILKQILAARDVDAKTEISLLITGQDKIRELNGAYLGEDRPTDVLSFPMLPEPSGATFVTAPDGEKHLGDIIISLPQAAIQAREHVHTTEREIAILLIHGVLHLLGYDHAEPEEESEMKRLEAEILGSIEKEIE